MDDLYSRALEISAGIESTPKNIERVASSTSTEAARWAFNQWTLRKRARGKFARADEMLFDRDGLEMASGEVMAAYHASKFPAGAFVADLSCGIGGDLVALASRGPTIGFELKAERSQMARHNLAVYGLEAQVREEDALMVLSGLEYAFADPARRGSAGRTLDASAFEPSPLALAEAFGGMKLGVMKLSAMLPDTFLSKLGGALEFVSQGRECKEALVSLGSSVEAGRFAVHVESGERLSPSYGEGFVEEEALEFVYEADPAAIRTDALPTLCKSLGLEELGDSNGYLTGSEVVASPWLAGYRVIEDLRGDIKETGRALKALSAKTPVVKTRTKVQTVEQLRAAWKMDGSASFVVIVYPVGKKVRHVIAVAL